MVFGWCTCAASLFSDVKNKNLTSLSFLRDRVARDEQ